MQRNPTNTDSSDIIHTPGRCHGTQFKISEILGSFISNTRLSELHWNYILCILQNHKNHLSETKREIVIKPELPSPTPSTDSSSTSRPIKGPSVVHKRSRENSDEDATPTKVAKTGTFPCAYCPHVYDKKVHIDRNYVASW